MSDAAPNECATSGEAGSLKWGVLSITGNFRENNEDSVRIDPAGRFFLVADGMGGQSAGEKASALAVELVGDRLAEVDPSLPAEDVANELKTAVADANTEIMALGNVEPEFSGMGTTLVSLLPTDTHFIAGCLGDSRVYRLRGGTLEQLTKDHSLTQALIDAGTITAEEAKTHRYKNMLFKYLGTKEGNEGGDAFPHEPASGDRFLLCSDGVTDGISDTTLASIVAECEPAEACDRLVAAAAEGGSRDNISCVVVHVG